MFERYLKTAFRHFIRHKTTTAINVACLALGLTCFVVAWGATAYYRQMDSYHSKASLTYALTSVDSRNGGSITLPINPWPLAEHLRAEYPQLYAVTRASLPQEAVISGNGVKRFANIVYADPSILHVFDLPFVSGDSREALKVPRSVVISAALAQQLFGTEAVVGRTLRLNGKAEASITGVVGSIRQPSVLTTDMGSSRSQFSLQFEALVSMDLSPANGAPPKWDMKEYFTFVVLPTDGSLSASAFNEQLEGFAKRVVPPELGSALRFRARPLSELTGITYDMFVGANTVGTSSMTLLIMLGALVLLTSCINYANLATAVAATRIKEMAIRRVIGANGADIAMQHVIEGVLLSGFALAVAITLIVFILLAAGAGSVLGIFLRMPQLWVFVLASVVVTGCLASAYPAYVLARIRPAAAIRGTAVGLGPRSMTTVLVGVQFGFAAFLLIVVLVMSSQSNSMKQAVGNTGGDPVVIIANDLRAANVDIKLLKSELRNKSDIVAVGAMDAIPWSLYLPVVSLTTTESASASRFNATYFFVDVDATSTLGLHLLAGRAFEAGRGADVANVAAWQRTNNESSAADFNVVVDRAMTEKLGLASPQAAIDKTIYQQTLQSGSAPPLRLHIIGVVENSIVRPLNAGYAMIYLMNPETTMVPIVRVNGRHLKEALANVDKVWNELAPDVPIKRRFGDEQFELSFRFLSQIDSLFGTLAVLAAIIALMGLLGMALHVVRRRIHEIGVRKALGASVKQILVMLLRSFSKPIVIANLVAWPIVYMAMRGYLSLFSVQSGITFLPFAASLLITLICAWAAVITQAMRAASISPATILRYE
jgi:putative ABC transport system permease protein